MRLCNWFLIGLFFLSLAFVSAAEGCCALTNDGKDCSYVDESECAVGDFSLGTTCEYASSCVKGCCYNSGTGVFERNILESGCTADYTGYIWDEGSCDNVLGSEEGCCSVGVASYPDTTKKECEIRGLGIGSEEVWDVDIAREDCFGSFYEPVGEGACVYDNGDCSILDIDGCNNLDGNLFVGRLCTDPDIGSYCEKTSRTSCDIDGNRDGVYFLDSCDNFANIYDASKVDNEAYWSKIIEPEDSCGAGRGDGNANSTDCGNCNRFSGGICNSAYEDGFTEGNVDFYCKDTSCTFEDIEGKSVEYENGESWCEYDGSIGSGTDVVGSRHWKYACTDGEVEVNIGCSDYRGEICVQNFLKGDEGGDLVTAKCVKNEVERCLEYNDDAEDGSEDCNEDPFCEIRGVVIDEFKFGVCSPKYPGGFDLFNESEEDEEKNEEICARGSETCISYYVKHANFGRFTWECEANCDCENVEFVEKMNDVCVGLGDCGGYVSYAEEFTDDGYSSNREQVRAGKINSYLDRAVPMPGLFVIMADYLSEVMGNGFLGTSMGGGNNDWPSFSDIDIWIERELFGIGGTKTKQSIFECKPWKAPAGGDDCGRCNEDPMKPCSEYRCESLGLGCEIVNANTDNELCDSVVDDGRAPVIVGPLDNVLSRGSDYREDDNGVSLISLNGDGGCFDAYSDIAFGIETSEPAYCKYDVEMNDFGNMSDFGNSNYVYDHSITYQLPNPGHVSDISEGADWTGNMTFYIKCQDRHGHETNGFYKVDSCVNEAPDDVSLGVRSLGDENTGVIGFDGDSEDLLITTWEPSTCRWSNVDGDYTSMENNMTCDDTLGQPSSALGYACTDTLPAEGDASVYNYYIRCMDQPWLEELGRSDERNEDVESYPYTLRRPESKIKIDGIIPDDEEIESLATTKEVVIQVKTSGGGEEHVCSYSLREEGRKIVMEDTRKERGIHKQTLSTLVAGSNYKVYVECVDELRDSVESEAEFNITRPTTTVEIEDIENFTSAGDVATVELRVVAFGAGDDYSCSYSVNGGRDVDFDEQGDGGSYRQDVEVGIGENTVDVLCWDKFDNYGSDDVSFYVNKSEIEIEIDSIDDITTGDDVVAVELRARAFGGGDDYSCSYSVNEGGYVDFDEQVDGGIYRQDVEVGIGNNEIHVRCSDEVGNEGVNAVSFEVEKDISNPTIARVWQDDGKLYVVTIEDVECKYSKVDCGFDWDEGSSIGSKDIHVITDTVKGTYYIRCVDSFGNMPSGCSVKVRIT